jgi:hypothetical protein
VSALSPVVKKSPNPPCFRAVVGDNQCC